MRVNNVVALGTIVMLGMTGCSAMREREWGTCAIAGGLAGGALGGVGGGLGVDRVEPSPTNGEVAAGAGAGFVTGAVLGTLIGHLVCDPMKQVPPPPPVAQATPPPPMPRKIAELHGPQFDFDKATLKPEGKRIVEGAVKTMKSDPNMRVSIEGHTDSVGSDAYNQRLSERRSNTVREYMVGEGIAPSRLTAVGFGESKPVASNETAEGRAQNRRVELMAR